MSIIQGVLMQVIELLKISTNFSEVSCVLHKVNGDLTKKAVIVDILSLR